MDIFPLAERLGDKYLLVHAGALWMQTEEYMAKLKSSEKYSNILFIGKLPNEKIHAYYEVADYVINFNTSLYHRKREKWVPMQLSGRNSPNNTLR